MSIKTCLHVTACMDGGTTGAVQIHSYFEYRDHMRNLREMSVVTREPSMTANKIVE